MQNVEIARRLEEVADLLEAQGESVPCSGVSSSRGGSPALTLIAIWEDQGDAGLRAVTGVGERLAAALRSLVTTGRLPMLDRLRGETDPVRLLESVPGIGPALAERLHGELGIDSLADLEAAAHDGRSADIGGIGKKKLAGIIDTLSMRLGRVRQAGYIHEPDEPPVEELLDVDREYREKADAGQLPTIAPRRDAWLPILYTHRGERNYTALYSNTARAHELGRIRDWVVLYYDGAFDERQATVITSHGGVVARKRIVRGREQECQRYYESDLMPSPAPVPQSVS